ncbi:UDP-N-acetylmuramoyl-L-alanyl-D-glutamate--2,6-diaminopimelate ligase [Buchnera aphidicola (Neophyllaphis podocarpi)]|uniref:UDP-N-acetylmuramoyl-L-alanyl-D-glutamate--2, 6-diaminopimelate ligase n=1 Tax=Buchnera aphidicola TaxID=9 RepID=UPI0031B83E82
MNIKLNKLLGIYNHQLRKIVIRNIKINSKNIKKKDLFIAIKGNKIDANKFIKEAINKGANAVISWSKVKNKKIKYINKIPIIYMKNIRKKISKIAGNFYNNPSNKLNILGVTGTNGKTSITQLISQWINLLGDKSAVIGTLGNGLYGKLIETINTTDSAIDIQSYLNFFLKNRVNTVSIEVSSHALDQYRVSSIPFKVGIFTNISRDHLDYHKNMKKYEKTKWKLFSDHKIENPIINISTEIGMNWFKKIKSRNKIYIATTNLKYKYGERWIYAKKVKYEDTKSIIDFNSSWGNGEISVNLIGNFNVVNILLSMAALLSLGYSLSSIILTVEKVKPIIGRMQQIYISNKPKIIIDYAHTPDALNKVIKIINSIYSKKKLTCIFGCGGDRDKTKRSIMGKIAEKLSNKVFITNDNPRTENQNKIIKDILSGFRNPKKAHVIPDRKKAIKVAINNSSINDIILIAGKGSENYQIIGKDKIKYSDEETVLKILNKKLYDKNILK